MTVGIPALLALGLLWVVITLLVYLVGYEIGMQVGLSRKNHVDRS